MKRMNVEKKPSHFIPSFCHETRNAFCTTENWVSKDLHVKNAFPGGMLDHHMFEDIPKYISNEKGQKQKSF